MTLGQRIQALAWNVSVGENSASSASWEPLWQAQG